MIEYFDTRYIIKHFYMLLNTLILKLSHLEVGIIYMEEVYILEERKYIYIS